MPPSMTSTCAHRADRGGERRGVDVDGVAILNRPAPSLGEATAQCRIAQEPPELAPPLVFVRGEKSLAPIFDDLAVDPDRRGNDRHAARHELDGLEAALPLRPFIVGQRIDANVAGVEELDLAVERPGL